MLRTALTLIIAAHGIGHILFLVPLLGIADWGQSARSWLLTGQTEARIIGGILWVLAIVGFLSAAYGLWSEQSGWRTAAVAAAIISSVGLVLFWTNPPTSPVISALVVNIIVLVALLLVGWPSAGAVGS